MMKNKANVLLSLIAILCSLGTLWYVNHKVDKIVVIDAIKVFNEFKMKKDLEAKVSVKLQVYTTALDSMKAVAENAMRRSDSGYAFSVANQMQQLQEEMGEAYNVSNQTINEQVWKRLNPLIDEFGKKEGYRVIIGANGMGSVLYKSDGIDRTNQALQYINSKYDKGE